ncbi:MAG: excinuclease ABC subunit UvrA, partial [Bdellovibrionaceae bacterium]|nr:excinuclease ABC subunit UvrA [Pseudobdellovibrionaceae bacterium]
EGVNNIPPSIAIEQKNSVRTSRSTVGTTTEIIDYLRLLYEKIGEAHCPVHHIPCITNSVTDATDLILKKFPDKRGYILVEIPTDKRVANGKKLLSLFLQDGYLRALVHNDKKGKSKDSSRQDSYRLIELSDPQVLKNGPPKDSFFIVVDRLQFTEQERNRIADSIHQAYVASVAYRTGQVSKRAVIRTTDGEELNLCEDLSCPLCEYTPPKLTAKAFSFNSPIGACPTCKGFGNILDLDENKVVPNPYLSIADGALHPFTMPSAEADRKQLLSFCKRNKIDPHRPWQELPQKDRELIWNGDSSFFGVRGLFEYLEQIKYKMHVRVFISRYRSAFVCPDCQGSRLRKDIANVLLAEKSIVDLSSMTIADLSNYFENLKLSAKQDSMVREILSQLKSRINFLLRVGVGYLSLNRETRTLSGGEYQRLMLANQLGMGLSQTLYVLDEPTVGLHPRDNDRLISIIKDLRDLGNTLVIVEHDHDVILNSENIIELGPGSGHRGGEIMYSGPTEKFLHLNQGNTAPFLGPNRRWTPPRETRPVELENYKFKLTIKGAKANNLKNITVTFPLNRLVAVTGVSGSGKSTLVTKTLYPAVCRALNKDYISVGEFRSLSGVEHLKNVVLIDQSPIGKSARSSPVTYMKAFDFIRTLMSLTPESERQGYNPGTFSLNIEGGRCPACKGTGYEEIDMLFMDNVVAPCDVCDGKRYKKEILEVRYKEKNIADILSLTVAEAIDFFVEYPNIRKSLSLLKEVGLEHLTLGQPASTLSGGESQRLKIARELSMVQQRSTLYILDEPTTGLHFREINMLMKVLHKLIESGGSVIVIEHNLDVILNSDYIIDMGPDGGAAGGKVVACGSPEEIMASKKSITGQYMRKYIGLT